MINEQDFRVPQGLAEGLKMTAICHTPHTGVAAVALIRAAADILTNDFGPEIAADLIRSSVDEALKMHQQLNAPAGRA